MKNKKVFVPVQTFKNLVSKDTLTILQVLDKHSYSIHQLREKTNISQERLQRNLQKLIDGKVIKTKNIKNLEQYTLTFKGSSLLHPENNRIMVLFSVSLLTLIISMGSFIHWIFQKTPSTPGDGVRLLQESDNVMNGPLKTFATDTAQNVQDPFYSMVALIGIVIFITLVSITFWRYQKNKSQAL